MAREGITYEQVAQVADKMVADGQQPTIRAVREALGTGSPNTVHSHLTAWRAARPQAQAQAPELPGELVLAIAQEIERAAARARSEIEGRLVDAQTEAGELATAGAALEVELAERLAEVATLMRVSKMTVYRLIHAGELQALRVGRSFRVPAKAASYGRYTRAAIAATAARSALAQVLL